MHDNNDFNGTCNLPISRLLALKLSCEEWQTALQVVIEAWSPVVCMQCCILVKLVWLLPALTQKIPIAIHGLACSHWQHA